MNTDGSREDSSGLGGGFNLPPLGKADASLVATRVNQYRIDREIGSGGFGRVYEAWAEDLERKVALKVLSHYRATRDLLRTFARERRALARVEHAHIAPIYDAGMTPSGAPYLVMRYVNGQRLTDYCDERRLGLRERVRLFEQICHAVQHAHAKGVVHCDLKPRNILVSRETGEPVIIDFGIARLTEAEGGAEAAAQQPIGTRNYMSPEQYAGDVDTRSDVYALGVVLCELLAGRVPLQVDQEPWEQAARRVREEAPHAASALAGSADAENAARRGLLLSALARRLAGDLDAIVRVALAKDPEQRYQTPAALADDLRRWAEQRPVRARAGGWWYQTGKFVRRNRAMIGAAGLVAATLVAGIVVTAAALSRARVSEAQARGAQTRSEQAHRDLSATTLRLAMERGDWETALEQIDRALVAKPADPIGLRLQRVQCLEALQRSDEAIAEAESIRASHPPAGQLGLTLAWLGDLYLMDEARASDAEDLLREALRHELPEAERRYVSALLREEIPAMIADLSAALEADKSHHRARWLLAMSYMLVGELDEAEAHLLAAEACKPRDEIAMAVLASLAAFRGDEKRAADVIARMRETEGPLRSYAQAATPLILWVHETLSGGPLEGGDPLALFSQLVLRAAPALQALKVESDLGAAEASAASIRFPRAIRSTWGEAVGLVFDVALYGTLDPKRAVALADTAARHNEGLMLFIAARLLLRSGEAAHQPRAMELLWQAADAPALLPVRRRCLYDIVHQRINQAESGDKSWAIPEERRRLGLALAELTGPTSAQPAEAESLFEAARRLEPDLASWLDSLGPRGTGHP